MTRLQPITDAVSWLWPGRLRSRTDNAQLVARIRHLAADYHFKNIAKGIIDSRDILYFLSLIFISLYGSHLVMQEKE